MSKTVQNTKYNNIQKYLQNGYTLIEILVGLTIIGILFSFGYVAFRDFSRREALSGTVKRIQGDFRLAQSMALAGQKPESPSDLPCRAPGHLDGYAFKVYSGTEYKIEAVCGSTNIAVKEVTMAGDVELATPSTNPIIFKVLGSGTNIGEGSEVVLTLTQSGTQNVATITITAGGEVK